MKYTKHLPTIKKLSQPPTTNLTKDYDTESQPKNTMYMYMVSPKVGDTQSAAYKPQSGGLAP